MYTLNCKGKLLRIGQPLVMGIINATPDSFYKGHLHYGPDGIISLAGKMINEGAAILDIGGQSTRPGSERISSLQEIERVIPVIDVIKSNMQTDSSDHKNRKFKNLWDTISQLYKGGGIKSFYKGLTPCLIRSFPTNAATFFAFEYTRSLLDNVF